MSDLIDRVEAIRSIKEYADKHAFNSYYNGMDRACKVLLTVPSAEPERKFGEWIPFTSHEPDAKEKEMYPDYEYVLDAHLPEDGQMILVTIACVGHERVQADEFYSDDGCYLDSGYDLISEAIAWMPLPEPYRKENEK